LGKNRKATSARLRSLRGKVRELSRELEDSRASLKAVSGSYTADKVSLNLEREKSTRLLRLVESIFMATADELNKRKKQ